MLSKERINEMINEFEEEVLEYTEGDEGYLVKIKVGGTRLKNRGLMNEYTIKTMIQFFVDGDFMYGYPIEVELTITEEHYNMTEEDFYDMMWSLLSEGLKLHYEQGKEKALYKRDREIKRMESKHRVLGYV